MRRCVVMAWLLCAALVCPTVARSEAPKKIGATVADWHRWGEQAKLTYVTGFAEASYTLGVKCARPYATLGEMVNQTERIIATLVKDQNMLIGPVVELGLLQLGCSGFPSGTDPRPRGKE